MDVSLYILDLIVFIGIFGILALSLNLEFGFAGLANFGKVAFFLSGAYTYATLAKLDIPFYVCLIGAAVVSAVFGLLISLPALRLRADYLAIVTLTFGEILRLVVKAERGIAGGVWGISVPPALSWVGSNVRADALLNVGLVYSCLILCFILAQLLANSPYGRIVRALREDEIAIEALGKDRSKYKAQVLMVGSGMAGISGGLYAQYIQFIDPYMFMPMITFTIWIMVILGGAANNWGVLAGAALVEIFDRGANIAKDYLALPVDPTNLQYIIFGGLIVFLLFYRPQGLMAETPLRTVRVGKRRDGAKAIRGETAS